MMRTRPTKAGAWMILGVVMSAAATNACATTRAEKAQADIKAMHEETSADKLLDLGRGFASVGDATRAEEYLAAALAQGANPKDVLPLLISVCVQTGKYRSALMHAENHLRAHPNDVQTRYVLGTIHAALGETKQARGALEQVVESRPDEAGAHYALALLARDSEDDVALADKHFREYLRIEPHGAHAEEARASLLRRVP